MKKIFCGRELIVEEDGQALVIMALCLVVLIGFLGLAIDMGHLQLEKHRLQNAADAAALAAALEIRVCGDTPNCSAMQTAAQQSLIENGIPANVSATNCASTSSSGVSLTLNHPVCAVAGDPNSGNLRVVEIMLARQVDMYFARVFGFRTATIRARAEAKRVPNGPCIYALNRSSLGAINVSLLAAVVSTCGIVDESSSPSAFTCLLSASVSAKAIQIAGGSTGLLCLTSPTPQVGADIPDPADPLAFLPKPNVPGCGSSTGPPYHGASGPVTVLLGKADFYADQAYCGGITIGPLATATFHPGIYVLKSKVGLLGLVSGGLNISLASVVSGTDVMFYNYGPRGSIVFTPLTLGGILGSTNLTASTNGTYGGILFFQDPGNTDPATLLLSSSLGSKLEGAYYFPTANVDVALSGPSAYNYLVANKINFMLLTAGLAQTTRFSNDYSTLANTSPLGGDNSELVQ